MKKRILSLLAACAVLTTTFVGLVQTAYAEGHSVSIVVTDDPSDDTKKTLTFYYEGTGADGLVAFSGDISISEGGTLNTYNYSGINPTYKGKNGTENMWFSDDNGASSADREFAKATVTVDTTKDVTVSLAVSQFCDADDWEDYAGEVGTVSVTIQKKAVTPPTPVVSTSVEAKQAFTTADNYDANVVVGTIQLTVSDAPIDLTKITYNDKEPEKVEGTDNPTAFQGSALITVIINGETDVNALNNIKFN